MRTRKRTGQTLIEITIATLVAAMTTTAVFSVILSSYVSDARADKRDAAAMVLKYAQDSLKSYVSTQPADPAYSPSYSGTNAGRWPTSGSALALSAGVHNINSLVSGPPLTMPSGTPATFSYTVTNQNCLNLAGVLLTDANQCKTVVFRLVYTD